MIENGRTYCLWNDIPSKDILVEEETEEIRKQLRLNHLGEKFLTLGLFIMIAYVWALRHTDLQNYVWNSLSNVFGLCHETKVTLNRFKNNSHEAVDTLQMTYGHLIDGQQKLALQTLVDLQGKSNGMKGEAQKTFKKCGEKSKIIQGVREEVVCNMSNNKEKMKELVEH